MSWLSFFVPSLSCEACRSCRVRGAAQSDDAAAILQVGDESIVKNSDGVPSASEALSGQLASSRGDSGALGASIRNAAQDEDEARYRADALHRGVCIDECFDLYDLAQQKVRVRKMTDALLGKPDDFSRKIIYGTASSRSDSSTSAGSEASTTPRRMSPRREGHGPTVEEIVTNWGALAGVLLHTRVLGFHDLAGRLIQRQRAQSVPRYRLMNSVQGRARGVLSAALKLAKLIRQQADCLDQDWNQANLLTELFTSEYVDTLLILANTARQVLSKQPMLLRVNAPCKIFGDIHGQLRDLLLLFNAYGSPRAEAGPSYIFNGDFVDRGEHQLEVIGLLFALKVLMPEKVWLLRGNHEDQEMNEKYGFRDCCRTRLGKEFGLKMYDHTHKAFDQLPVACVVGGRILIVHGGIGQGRWTLRDVENVPRPLTGDVLHESHWIYNILWSDPLDEEENGSTSKSDTFGVHGSPRRQNVVTFGWNVTKMFCARNGLGLIVRSHECKLGGLGFNVMHERRLIRVFSARDYEENGNGAAVLSVSVSQAADSLDSDSVPMLTVRPQVLCSLAEAQTQGSPQTSPRRPPAQPKPQRKKTSAKR